MNATATNFVTSNRLTRTELLTEPAGYVAGNNLYEYVGSNPVNEQDPTGLSPMLPDPGFGGGGSYDNESFGETIERFNQLFISQWMVDQKQKLGTALKNICPQNGSNCCDKASCEKQAQEIADSIITALGEERRRYGSQMGGDWGNFSNRLLNPLWLRDGLSYRSWLLPEEIREARINNECGDWQVMVGQAADAAINKQDKSCFQTVWFSGTDPRFHQWIGIETSAGLVVVDPWPTGSKGDVVDTSQSSRFPAPTRHPQKPPK